MEQEDLHRPTFFLVGWGGGETLGVNAWRSITVLIMNKLERRVDNATVSSGWRQLIFVDVEKMRLVARRPSVPLSLL